MLDEVTFYGLITSIGLNVIFCVLLMRKRFRYKKLRRQRFQKRLEGVLRGEHLMSKY